jgi:hypothetical protein
LIDDAVSQGADYYYKITSQDQNNNISFYSSIIHGKADATQDAGEGGGGQDSTGPVITGVQIPSITLNTNSAVITWTTNEVSNSSVDYTTSPIGAYTDTKSVASFVTSHSVAIAPLTASTTYYIQVRSSDPSSNETSNDNGGTRYSFSTHQGPAITDTVLEEVTNNAARISWITDMDADSYVVYSTSSNFTTQVVVGDDTKTQSHSFTLTGLVPDTSLFLCKIN